MGRLINTESAGKDRNRLTRGVVLAIRELMKQTQPDDKSRDLAAFIALALLGIAATIDDSVAAWEKRGYWVKADRFRMEWSWTERMGSQMRKAVLEDDWMTVASTSIQVAQKLMAVQIPEHHRLGTPWEGAWGQLKKQA
ncbi:MAG TPA: hypothetical protein VHO48_04630 [Anaerolineaceae bacterium]|nr:hypothetical protein [Anaerolineaceae bacterium]